MKSYGITQHTSIKDQTDAHIENISLRGYSIEHNILDKNECDHYCQLLDKVCAEQELAFGTEKLKSINESDIARMPFVTEPMFLKLLTNPTILELTAKILGPKFHLHLQNGILNKPGTEHHQSSWHRDLPYQDWIISKPLGFNAFYCLTDFTIENGATAFLPYSHKFDRFPSTEFVASNQLQLTAPAGSVLFFDSMIYHCATQNHSDQIRYGLNNMFVVPIIKQQVDVTSCIESSTLTQTEKAILGFDFETPKSVLEFREKRLQKLKK